MKLSHIITLVAVLVVGYLIGVKYPHHGAAALAKVGM